MEIKINSKKLKKIINNFNSVITDFDPINENTGIQIDALENKIIFKGKNKNISIRDELIIENNEIGGFLIKSKTINEAINKFDEEEITIRKEKNNSIELESKNISYSLNLLNGNYSYIPKDLKQYKKILEMDSNSLKDNLRSIIFCASEKNSRIVLRSINFGIKGNELSLIASDETKIGISKSKINKIIEDINFSISLSTIKDLLKIIDSGNVEFYINDDELVIINKSKQISFKIIENIYPNVSKFIPKKFEKKITIKKEIILNIFNKAMLINSIKSISETPTKLVVRNKKLVLETKDEGIGKAVVNTNELIINFDDFYILFNPKFVVETIKSINDEFINIEFNQSDEPFLVTGRNDGDHKVLILPYADN